MTPHLRLLAREATSLEIAKHLQLQLRLLSDAVDYGTNLIVRCFDGSKRMRKDVVVLQLSTYLLQMVDSCHLLLSSGSVRSAKVVARCMLEASFLFDWVTSDAADGDRAVAYFVANMRRERMWARRMITGSEEHADLSRTATENGLSAPEFADDKVQEAKSKIAAIDDALGRDPLKAVDLRFEAEFKKRNFEPDWFRCAGAQSIRDVAQQVKRLHEYRTLYSIWSSDVHAAGFSGSLQIAGPTLVIEPFRTIEGVVELLGITMALAIRLFRDLLAIYREEELDNFRRKYVSEWRTPFATMPRIVVESSIFEF